MIAVRNRMGDLFHPPLAANEFSRNCGGYALDLDGWFVPYINEDRYEEELYEARDEVDYWKENSFEENVRVASECYNYIAENNTVDEFWDMVKEYFCFNTLSGEEQEDIVWELEHWSGDNMNCVSFAAWVMTGAFPWLRYIHNEKDNSINWEKEYVIVFAVGNNDFHFGRFDQEIGWTHKMGGQDVRIVKDVEEIFGHRYDSEIIYFAALKKEYR